MKPHKHAEVIKAWADGFEVQYLHDSKWYGVNEGHFWMQNGEYRIKPAEPEKVYPVTNLSAHDFFELGFGDLIGTKCRAIANAAIRRAIDDGQVFTKADVEDHFNEIMKIIGKAK